MTTNYCDPHTLIYIQSRAAVDPALVEEYARMMADDVGFDPVQAVSDGAQIYVWDGYHRGEAAKQAGKLLFVVVRPGSREEAEWLALSANQKHGLRRSNADKRRVVELALRHPKGAQMSDNLIAHHCGVSQPFVSKMRAELAATYNGYKSDDEATAEIPQSTERTGADGRTINTANIGGKALTPTLSQGEREDSPIGEKPRSKPREETVMCPHCDDSIFLEMDTRPNGAIVCDCCKHRFASYEALLKAVDAKRKQQEGEAEELQRRLQSETRYCRFCDHPQEISGDDVYHKSRVICNRCYRGWPASDWPKEPRPKNGQQPIQPPPQPSPSEGEGAKGQFDCPYCQQEKVVHVNGGAWCMECGVRWISVESFKLDYKNYEAQRKHQAHERNLQALKAAAGSEAAAQMVLEMEQVYNLQKQAITLFNRVLDTTIIEDLEALIALLEDFEMDTPPEAA